MLARQSIEYLPHKLIVDSTECELDQWLHTNKAYSWGSWLLPQLVAHFGSWELQWSGSEISIRETLKHNCRSNLLAQACWRLSRVTRSQIVSNQAKNPQYGTLVPVILLGFKRMQNIAYSRWQGLLDLDLLLEPRLHEATVLDPQRISDLCSLGSERLLELRTHGLQHKSTGVQKPAQSTWSLTGMQGSVIGDLPKLTQSILTQIWLAHPQTRHCDMILDLNNWDLMPPPLVKADIFQVEETSTTSKTEKTAQQAKNFKPDFDPKVPPWI